MLLQERVDKLEEELAKKASYSEGLEDAIIDYEIEKDKSDREGEVSRLIWIKDKTDKSFFSICDGGWIKSRQRKNAAHGKRMRRKQPYSKTFLTRQG